MKNDIVEYDEKYLARAFVLARKGRFTTMPNPNVGCVIVHNNRIVGEGYHFRAGEDHAEIHALKMAGDYSKGATAYITLEPCCHFGRTPPCVKKLVDSGIKKVVISMLDPNPDMKGKGVCYLRNAGIKVRYGLMLSQAESINRGFLKLVRTGLPLIRMKLASSLDGRSAMASGESKWITSIQSRQDVQIFRAESGAIISTSITVLMDNPRLSVRWTCFPKKIKHIYEKNQVRQPLRVIIDSSNRILPSHRLIQCAGKILLVRLKKDCNSWPKTVKQLLLTSVKQNGINRINLIELIKYLASQGINNIWIEAGASFSGAILNFGLVDELVLYQAMKLLGSEARPLCFLPNVKYLDDVRSFKLLEVKTIGPDIRLTLCPMEKFVDII